MILKDIGRGCKDIRLINDLHTKQKVVVRVDEYETEEMGIERGVSKGAVCHQHDSVSIYASGKQDDL